MANFAPQRLQQQNLGPPCGGVWWGPRSRLPEKAPRVRSAVTPSLSLTLTRSTRERARHTFHRTRTGHSQNARAIYSREPLSARPLRDLPLPLTPPHTHHTWNPCPGGAIYTHARSSTLVSPIPLAIRCAPPLATHKDGRPYQHARCARACTHPTHWPAAPRMPRAKPTLSS